MRKKRRKKMEFFKKNCRECKKEISVGNPSEEAFCSKICETNYKWRKGAFSGQTLPADNVWDAERTKRL